MIESSEPSMSYIQAMAITLLDLNNGAARGLLNMQWSVPGSGCLVVSAWPYERRPATTESKSARTKAHYRSSDVTIESSVVFSSKHV